MSGGGPAAIVCGFSDLAAGLGGLAWELGGRGGLVLNGNEVQKAEVGICRKARECDSRCTQREPRWRRP